MKGKKAAAPMTEAEYQAMCDRMTIYAQRGRKEQEIVKSIAKAGNVTPVLEYVDKFRKMFVKFQAQQSGARRNGSKE